jgi:hypothetical protein
MSKIFANAFSAKGFVVVGVEDSEWAGRALEHRWPIVEATRSGRIARALLYVASC